MLSLTRSVAVSYNLYVCYITDPVVNAKGSFKSKAKVLTGFIKSRTKLPLELKPVVGEPARARSC
jgi:hypothetical protein